MDFYNNIADGIRVTATATNRIATGLTTASRGLVTGTPLTNLATAVFPDGSGATGFYATTLGSGRTRFYNNLALSLYEGTAAGLDNMAAALFPASDNGDGFYSLAAGSLNAVATKLYGATGTGLDNLALALFPTSDNSAGFYSLAPASLNAVATKLYGVSTTGLSSLVSAIFPDTAGSTGFYGLSQNAKDTLYTAISTALYEAGTGLDTLIQTIFPTSAAGLFSTGNAVYLQNLVKQALGNYPLSAAGTTVTQDITTGTKAFEVTATCASTAFLMGGTYEVTCAVGNSAAGQPDAAALDELAASVVNLQKASIVTGTTANNAKVFARYMGGNDVDYYSLQNAEMCVQYSTPICRTGAGGLYDGSGTAGCCDLSPSTNTCSCGSCNAAGDNFGNTGCDAGCRCFTNTAGDKVDTDTCRGVVASGGENFYQCLCTVKATPVCASLA